MRTLPLRLPPGVDLRRTLEAAVAAEGVEAAFVLQGIGSLAPVVLRLAGAESFVTPDGSVELLTLAGSISAGGSPPHGGAGAGGSHLHASVACGDGRVLGGHLAYGSTVHTTAEVLLALLPDWAFVRGNDPATGFAELVVTRRVG